jgi:glycosyltransferase involved in cell wall biosynthesis
LAGVRHRELRERKLGPLRLHAELLSKRFLDAHDVVVVEGRLSLIASLALLESGLPVVWWTSLWRKDGTIGPQRGPLGFVTKRALGKADAIVTYGHAAAQAAVENGAPQDRVFVAPNSLDTPRLVDAESSWRADPPRLAEYLHDRGVDTRRAALFLGRLIPDKKLHLLIHAWARVVGRHVGDSPLLMIVGDGPERSSLVETARRLGIEDRIRFMGDVRDIRMVCPFILGARALVLPGAGGLAVNQAMTHGLPPVVGGGDGTERDVIEDGRNGFMVRSGDPEDLALRIEDLLFCTDERWSVFSRGAREAIERRANLDLMIQGLAGAVRTAARRAQHPGEVRDESTLLPAGGA